MMEKVFLATFYLLMLNRKDLCMNGKLPLNEGFDLTSHIISGYPCRVCHKVYKAKRSLWRHVKFECQKAPSFTCPMCPYMGKQKSTVVNHMLNKHSSSHFLAPDSYMNVICNIDS